MERTAMVTTSPTILADEDTTQLRLVLTQTGGVIGIPYNPALLTDGKTANALGDLLRPFVPDLVGSLATPNPGEQFAYDKDSDQRPYVFVFPDKAVVPVASILATKPAAPSHPVVNGHDVTWVLDADLAPLDVSSTTDSGELGRVMANLGDKARAAEVAEMSDHQMIAAIYAAVVK